MPESARIDMSSFHVMTKPTGPLCNLNCTYCFYLEKENLYPDKSKWAMPHEVLESYVRQYIEAQDLLDVNFAWQGGEPTILGVDYFKNIAALQRTHANGKRIANSFQTNGVLLDDAWCEFLAQNKYLVGLSIDGPRELHDHYRVDKGGHPTFDRVMRGIGFLKKHGVEFNTLTCVQAHNSLHPLKVYRFLKEVGSGYMQFIPIIERIASDSEGDALRFVSPSYEGEAKISKWPVRPLQHGKFLAEIFDEWVRNDVGRVFVQAFDVVLEAWLGMDPSLCVHSAACGKGLALEHNGDLYSCDHFVYPENRVGNIMEQSLRDLVNSEQQRGFGLAKRDSLPRQCRECPVRFACNGGCPKHRFTKTKDGEAGLNYLCEGFTYFFTHIAPYMRFMADELRAERAPANVMAYARMQDLRAQGRREPLPNDLCVCGSGRKYKKCCGTVSEEG